MHGLIMVELRNYVTEKFDGDTWNALLKKADLWPRQYVPVDEYPDEEIFSLVGTASEMTGLAANDILVDFGQFITKGLIKGYGPLIRKEWKTLDVIYNTEATIHTAVRLRHKEAKPPELRVERISPSEVKVVYASHRKLCRVAYGIAMGLAKHFGETIHINEARCMHHGDAQCEISISCEEAALRAKEPQPVKVAAAAPKQALPTAAATAAPPVDAAAPPVRRDTPQPAARPAPAAKTPKKKRSFWSFLFRRL